MTTDPRIRLLAEARYRTGYGAVGEAAWDTLDGVLKRHLLDGAAEWLLAADKAGLLPASDESAAPSAPADRAALHTGIYVDLDAYQRQFRISGLQHAQIRDHLATYIADGLLRRMTDEAQQAEPAVAIAVRRMLRRWAYAAGHIESELDGAVNRMYEAIAREITRSPIAEEPRP